MTVWVSGSVPGAVCVVLTCDRQHKRSHTHSSAQYACGHLPIEEEDRMVSPM